MKLSVLIPIYNEATTLRKIVERVLSVDLDKEIILVNDASTDGTPKIIEELQKEYAHLIVFHHERNLGKGAAIRTALRGVSGDYIIIQDADLEYDPQEYHKMLEPVRRFHAQVVYGSRFKGVCKNMFCSRFLGNKFLSFVTDMLYNTTLSDMETCYKLIETNLLKNISLRSKGFELEPEITAKLLRKKIRIFEVPISYAGRGYEEGKKITWKDGFVALWTLLKYRFVD
ncbi:MAG: glycosyltransferase family 2 protein [Chlamydiae bacterium]|nr:glycosyltransferase family 2 protein [Chlamydiota bacterium]MBI3276591.1 glycosyltransferase family 2 protein [Chlamydiota bacterium]